MHQGTILQEPLQCQKLAAAYCVVQHVDVCPTCAHKHQLLIQLLLSSWSFCIRKKISSKAGAGSKAGVCRHLSEPCNGFVLPSGPCSTTGDRVECSPVPTQPSILCCAVLPFVNYQGAYYHPVTLFCNTPPAPMERQAIQHCLKWQTHPKGIARHTNYPAR